MNKTSCVGDVAWSIPLLPTKFMLIAKDRMLLIHSLSLSLSLSLSPSVRAALQGIYMYNTASSAHAPSPPLQLRFMTS
jgi:hypothetical protein